jgi:hypothetical protein
MPFRYLPLSPFYVDMAALVVTRATRQAITMKKHEKTRIAVVTVVLDIAKFEKGFKFPNLPINSLRIFPRSWYSTGFDPGSGTDEFSGGLDGLSSRTFSPSMRNLSFQRHQKAQKARDSGP